MMQTLLHKSLAAALCLFTAMALTVPSKAQEPPIVIYTVVSDGSTKLEKTDFFYDALSLLLPKDGFNHELHEVSHIRSAHLFFANKASCRFPANLKDFNKGFKRPVPELFVESDAFLINNIRVLSAAGKRPPKNGDDMRGKALAIPVGSIFHNQLNIPDTDVIQTATDLKRLEMLAAGRIDLVMLSMPSAIRLFPKEKGMAPVYDPDLSLLEFTHHLSCHRTEQNVAFIEAINQQIRGAKQSGALEAIFTKHRFDLAQYYPKD